MNRYSTKGIVLTRTDFGEAARILTFLTPHHGKVRAMARGVRKSNSKLAGGIELFSISDLTLLVGRSELHTLISARLDTYFQNIVKNIDSTQAAYEVLKVIQKNTDDGPEEEYFNMLSEVLTALDQGADAQLILVWFYSQLLQMEGHAANLRTDNNSQALKASEGYLFDFSQMGFEPYKDGPFNSDHIKLLRLAASSPVRVLGKLEADNQIAEATLNLLKAIQQQRRI